VHHHPRVMPGGQARREAVARVRRVGSVAGWGAFTHLALIDAAITLDAALDAG